MLFYYIVFTVAFIWILVVLSLSIYHFRKDFLYREWQKKLNYKKPELKDHFKIRKEEIDREYNAKIKRTERAERFINSLIPFIKIN